MDDSQIKPTAQADDVQGEDDQMLPPVQDQSASGGTSGPAAAGVAGGQTIPTDRSLVPTPEEAADSDLIEKEWVIKAKEIVEHTAEDPFLQQQELSKMKAAYMKKRYNKDIGLSSGA
jgi:hypothetical protein